DRVLSEARKNVADGDLPRALHAYNHLIQHNRLIDDILPELAQLVKKFSRDPQAWRTLGDALDRAGDVDHAAKSYEQARKLMHDIVSPHIPTHN
ncbi:MAG TPA: tetratricopeptide repeat protein, partial [Anaerolineales bacterium]|nr:tetratricopeptide repeat protein [Anaerolineales bacterium]